MHKILEKRQLSYDKERDQSVFYYKVEAPEIARNRKAGQFIIFQLDEDYGERIPLTIADANPEEGWIAIVFQTVGATTRRFSATFNEGDNVPVLVGPLGKPTHIQKHDGAVLCVGGGIGIAPLHPIVEANHKIGNKVITIIGARTKELLFFEDEMRAPSDELIIVTDDGSYGRKAVVTEPLKEICEREKVSEIVSIGPAIMMKFCVAAARPFNVPITTSLNTIMIDGTGMCGCCRVKVGDKTKFVCVDGPEFNGYEVDFDNMMQRMTAFKDKEREADHKCRIGLDNGKVSA